MQELHEKNAKELDKLRREALEKSKDIERLKELLENQQKTNFAIELKKKDFEKEKEALVNQNLDLT